VNRRNLIIAAILLGAGAVALRKPIAQLLPNGNMTQQQTSVENTAVTPEPISGRPQVEIDTAKGKIVLELRPDVAPKTVANYLGKWSRGECNNLTFHRVEDWVVQGCDPAGDGTGGNSTLPTENSQESFTAGALGERFLAVPADVSNDSQFFIVKKDSKFLDGQYTYFGKVLSGLDVINSLSIGDKIISTTILTK